MAASKAVKRAVLMAARKAAKWAVQTVGLRVD